MANNVDPGQTARMRRLIWLYTDRIGHKPNFIMVRHNYVGFVILVANYVGINEGHRTKTHLAGWFNHVGLTLDFSHDALTDIT